LYVGRWTDVLGWIGRGNNISALRRALRSPAL